MIPREWAGGGVPNTGGREKINPFQGKLGVGWVEQLTVNWSRDDSRQLRELVAQYVTNSPGIEKLRRARITPRNTFPLANTSFGPGLYMHVTSISWMGHTQLARTVEGILQMIETKAIKQGRSQELDDFVRQHLKVVHDIAFPRVVREGPAWMFLCHLQALGGRRAWEREAVEKRIADWVDCKHLLADTTGHREQLRHIFNRWVPRAANRAALTFKEFANDPMRWGTAGGAKKTKIAGEEYRTKWAWAWGRKVNETGWVEDVDLYAEAMKQNPDVAVVALKEEATKTREIITTSMASYLRQSYLAYLWGRPPVNSPIGKRRWLTDFQGVRYSWYAAVDGKNFDHHVALWFVVAVLRHMGEASDEAASVAQEEIEHLKKLVVKMDDKVWKYVNGVLSGWRLTSLLDTLATECVVGNILQESGMAGAFTTGSMGDDLIIASHTKQLPPKWLVEMYDRSGMETNASKTTTGAVGEFLRKVYAPSGILGYPALGLKGCMYASPWISNYDPNNPQELAKNWMTWLSRLLPLVLAGREEYVCDKVKKQAEQDLRRWGISAGKGMLRKLLSTPISAGGLGCVEWMSEGSDWAVIECKAMDRQTRWMNKFGIGKAAVTAKSDYTARGIALEVIREAAKRYKAVGVTQTNTSLPYDKNLSREMVQWYFDDAEPATRICRRLGVTIPHGLRVAGKSAILDYLMGQMSGETGITTIQTTPELTSTLSRTYKSIGNRLLFTKAGKAIRNAGAALTYYQMAVRTHASVTRGTW